MHFANEKPHIDVFRNKPALHGILISNTMDEFLFKAI
jgi:hypothetical protein